MPRYIVERTFPNRLEIQIANGGAEICGTRREAKQRAGRHVDPLLRQRRQAKDLLRLRRAHPRRDPSDSGRQRTARRPDHRGARPRPLLLPVSRGAGTASHPGLTALSGSARIVRGSLRERHVFPSAVRAWGSEPLVVEGADHGLVDHWDWLINALCPQPCMASRRESGVSPPRPHNPVSLHRSAPLKTPVKSMTKVPALKSADPSYEPWPVVSLNLPVPPVTVQRPVP